MIKYSAAEQRFFKSAIPIAAQRLIFSRLPGIGVPFCKLSEIADTISGGTPHRGNSTHFGGSIAWLKSGELNDGVVSNTEEMLTDSGLENSNAKVLPAGTLLIALYGATVGKTSILGMDAATNQAVCAVIPKTRDVNLRYLHWFLRHKRKDFLSTSFGGAQPNISQRILRETHVPFPPPYLQDGIAAFLDAVERRTRDPLIPLPELPASLAEQRRHTGLAGKRSRKLGQILKLDEDRQPILSTGSYPQVGVKSFGGGLFPKSAVAGTATTYRAFNRLYEGALLLSQVKGWEGAVAVCSADLAGWFVSPEYRTFRCIPTEARPGYLASMVRTEWFWSRLATATRGVGARRERTRPEHFLNIELPMPDVGQQKQGEALFLEMNAMKSLQAETAAELDGLVPAILERAFKGEL
jgi:hypothetical protein